MSYTTQDDQNTSLKPPILLNNHIHKTKHSINMTNNNQTPLVFKVTRSPPELLPPAGPTPKEFKALSDIDDQEALRFHIPVLQIYRNNGGPPFRGARDPAKVIKEAVRKALVPYYPFAGRLREKAGKKLVVECNGKGILFIEAHADVTLEEFGEEICPPFPCFEELLFDVPGSSEILDSPLLLIQVTKLKCGAFIFAVKLNHTVADGAGGLIFLNTVACIARGDQKIQVQPVWERHLLCARDPPQVTHDHREYDALAGNPNNIPLDDLVHKSFFFGPKEISILRGLLPPHLQTSSTTNEVLTAFIWRCRTIALQLDPNDEVRFINVVNTRPILNPPLPEGYYGNVIAFLPTITTAGELILKPLGFAVELIKKAKVEASHEYMTSLIDHLHTKGRPRLVTGGRSLVISNLTRSGIDRVDYGWGPPVYGGTAGELPGIATFYMPYKNRKGERGIVVPLCLPALAMERFVKVVASIMGGFPGHQNVKSGSSVFISSTL